MQNLSPNDVESLLTRFKNFYDSVILDITTFYGKPSFEGFIVGEPFIEIAIATKDYDDNWEVIRLVFTGRLEFSFRQPDKHSYAVLSDGIRISWFGDRIFIDLDVQDDSNTPASYRESRFYIAADQCLWDTSPWNSGTSTENSSH